MNIINLTPHQVAIFATGDVTRAGARGFVANEGALPALVIPPANPSSPVAAKELVSNDEPFVIDGIEIPVVRKSFGEVINLPEPETDTFYVVSAIAANAAKAAGRTDCLIVDGTVYDSPDPNNRRIVGCVGFAKP